MLQNSPSEQNLSIVRALITAVILTLLLSSPGLSVTEIPKTVKPIINIGLTPTLGGLIVDSEQGVDSAPMYGLKFSYDHIGSTMADSLGVELTGNYLSSSTSKGGQKASAYLFRTDAIYSIGPRNKWVPYLVVGLGGLFLDKNGTRDNSPLFNYGMGIRYFYEDYLAFRFDARQLFVYDAIATSNDYEVSTGVTYYFGKERKKPVPPKPKPTTLPKAVPIISETEAAPGPVEPNILEKLAGLGAAILGVTTEIPEYAPAPGVPAPGTLARRPAAAPPEAPAPQPVVAQSADVEVPADVEPEMIDEVYTIEFLFSSPQVRPIYNKQLARTAARVKASPSTTVRIEGHTDNVGKSTPNIVLSEKRANNVKKVLVKYGVDPKKVTTKGYGFTRPKATNTTEEGKQKNRRALVVTITPKKDKKDKDKKVKEHPSNSSK